jgi:hypothetical protein
MEQSDSLCNISDKKLYSKKVQEFNLPITFGCDRHICMLSLEMILVKPTKYDLTTFSIPRITVKPEGKYWLLYQILAHHIIPVSNSNYC